ncbi:MAG: hypothetical protein FJ087_15010, partial [Deltaproteobacteria bacterium]|nr:hypothetical protein [Deltaproteobacteria bacterium]
TRKSFEAFLTALDGAPDDPGLLEEAATAAAAVGDNDALLALLGRRRDAAHDNRGRIEATLAAAKLLEDLGRTDEAAVEYRRALSVDPNRHEAFEALVALLSQAGSTGDARREYEAVLARTFDPGTRSRVLRRYAALVSEAFRDDEAAASALQEALSLDPADEGLLDQLEPLYQRLGQWPRLMSLWRRRVERARNGTAVPVLLRMTEAAAGPMRDPESALAFATEAARRAPEDPEPRTRVRRLHETLGLWAEVCRDLERDVETAPPQEKAALLARIAETYETRLSLADKAKAAYARALEFATGPEAVRVGKRLADLHRRDSERDRELAALEVAVKAMSDDTAADHLAQMGRRALEAPPDRDAAKGYLESAVRLNPVHAAAVETLAGLLLTLNRPERVPALVEPLAAKAATASDTAGERRLRLLAGGAAARVGDTEAALTQYARAAELDPADTRTRVVLGRMYAQVGRDTEAARLLSAVLDSATDDLTPMDRIEVHVQTARCASRLGDHQRALSLLDAAFRLRGTADAETLREMVAAAEAAKDPERLAEYLDRWIAIETSGTQKFAFMLRLGDVLKDELGAPERALRWYRAAQKENPSSKAALHKALDAAVAATDYREAKSLLVAIMELEQDGLKRAQYHYGAALIARDNLGDLDVTRQHLAAAIELNPDIEEAVSAQEDLLVQAGDHEGLASLYQLLARHYRLNGRDDRMVAMLRRLAACYEERLHNLPLAAETLRQIREAVPGDEEVADRLAAVLMRTPGREKDALEAHRAALAVDPTNAASYRAVRELCLVAGDADGAWCAAAALHSLGAANEAEEAAFEAGRQAALKLKRDTLPPDAFRRLVVDEAADEGVGRVLHILYPPLRRLLPNMWKQPRDLGLADADLVNPSERGLFQNMAAAASKVFGVPLPRVYRARGRAGIAKVPFDPPALAVGDDVLTAWRGKELRFSTARALVSFAPGFVLSGIADHGTLRVFFLAGLRIAFPDYPTPADAAGVDDLASELVGLLSPEARMELSDILTEFRRRKVAIDLHGFLAGADRTAARAGLFMANDLAVAKNQLADESLALSDLEFGDRLTDLCAYAVSARYAELRKLMLQV